MKHKKLNKTVTIYPILNYQSPTLEVFIGLRRLNERLKNKMGQVKV